MWKYQNWYGLKHYLYMCQKVLVSNENQAVNIFQKLQYMFHNKVLSLSQGEGEKWAAWQVLADSI
jgi:hypothetical protein